MGEYLLEQTDNTECNSKQDWYGNTPIIWKNKPKKSQKAIISSEERTDEFHKET